MHVRPSDSNDSSTVETLKVLHGECGALHLDKSLGEVCSTLFGRQKKTKVKTLVLACLSVCARMCDCVRVE